MCARPTSVADGTVMDSVDLDVLHAAVRWHLAGHRVFLGTVVRPWGPALRPVGSMIVTAGAVRASDSGGGGQVAHQPGAGQAAGQVRPSDFGLLVNLSEYGTFGNLGCSIKVAGLVVRTMYKSLYRRHLTAVHGPVETGLNMLTDKTTRRTEPRVKLHSVARRPRKQHA
jgi:hypothetical protein